MAEEQVPLFLEDKRLIKLDISRLISGASASQAQERLLVIIDEVAHAGNIILYIENVENISGITSGSEESLDLSEVLSGALERKNLFCLATATTDNYAKYIENTPLGNSMANIKIKEPVGNQAIQIIESKIGPLEAKYNIYFSYNSLEHVINLSNKYIHDKFLPAKAIDILELVAVKVKNAKGSEAVVTKDDIAEVVSETTGIPSAKVTENESDTLLNLEELIHERMVDQEEAVDMVAASLRRARAEMREGKRPIASFLFLGPTGVGKTELAKTISAIYFKDEKKMIRLDMSEYQHQDSIEKMIGASDKKGYLTEAVRKAPFSLVLLDEFEKAHPDILNLFLQVFDDGRLTDGQGKTIDFTNTIFIATSNTDAVYIQEQVRAGIDIEKIKNVLINDHLNRTMRPELINRFDGIIVFKPLSENDLIAITKIMLKNISRTLENKGVKLEIMESGIAILAKLGYDPQFGARPLRRLIQNRIENIIANMILAGGLARRDTVIIDENANIQVEKGRRL
jgi:ATP-dependent Clp protease ATP-binding subunit ClpC